MADNTISLPGCPAPSKLFQTAAILYLETDRSLLFPFLSAVSSILQPYTEGNPWLLCIRTLGIGAATDIDDMD